MQPSTDAIVRILEANLKLMVIHATKGSLYAEIDTASIAKAADQIMQVIQTKED